MSRPKWHNSWVFGPVETRIDTNLKLSDDDLEVFRAVLPVTFFETKVYLDSENPITLCISLSKHTGVRSKPILSWPEGKCHQQNFWLGQRQWQQKFTGRHRSAARRLKRWRWSVPCSYCWTLSLLVDLLPCALVSAGKLLENIVVRLQNSYYKCSRRHLPVRPSQVVPIKMKRRQSRWDNSTYG